MSNTVATKSASDTDLLILVPLAIIMTVMAVIATSLAS